VLLKPSMGDALATERALARQRSGQEPIKVSIGIAALGEADMRECVVEREGRLQTDSRPYLLASCLLSDQERETIKSIADVVAHGGDPRGGEQQYRGFRDDFLAPHREIWLVRIGEAPSKHDDGTGGSV
jgi:hypothetical protein